MSSMGERMTTGQRIVLITLLALVAFGFVGHALGPTSGIHHQSNEANCAFHSSCVVPLYLVDVVETNTALPIERGPALAFSVSIKIPHPPIL